MNTKVLESLAYFGMVVALTFLVLFIYNPKAYPDHFFISNILALWSMLLLHSVNHIKGNK